MAACGGGELGVTETTVLVLEDERGLASLYAAWLGDDYDIRLTDRADEAKAVLDEEVDVALIDRRLPGEPGDEVLEWLRDQAFDCRAAMLTAVHPGADLLELPVDDYLIKPVDRTDVEATVERLARLDGYSDPARRVASLSSRLAFLRDQSRPLDDDGTAEALRRRLDAATATLEDADVPADDAEDLAAVLPDDSPVPTTQSDARGPGPTDDASVGVRDGDPDGPQPRTDGDGRPREDASTTRHRQEDDRLTRPSAEESTPTPPGAGPGAHPPAHTSDRDDPGPQNGGERGPVSGGGDAPGTAGNPSRYGRDDVDDTIDPGFRSPRESQSDTSRTASADEWVVDRTAESVSGLTVRHDPSTGRYRARHDEDVSLVVTVMETVAAAEGRDPTSFRPVHDHVDTHALDELFAGDGEFDGGVTFEYAGYWVTITDGAEVVVEPRDASPTSSFPDEA
jgi:DNA-binding response OmpR family regulator